MVVSLPCTTACGTLGLLVSDLEETLLGKDSSNGRIVVSALSLGTNYIDSSWSWRIPALGQGLPSVIQIIFIWWIPESPRYLMAKDKHEKALDILARYHGNGNANDPTVQFEYREIKETIKMEMEAKSNSSYLDFFKTKGNRYRLIVLLSLGLFSQWSAMLLSLTIPTCSIRRQASRARSRSSG